MDVFVSDLCLFDAKAHLKGLGLKLCVAPLHLKDSAFDVGNRTLHL